MPDAVQKKMPNNYGHMEKMPEQNAEKQARDEKMPEKNARPKSLKEALFLGVLDPIVIS
jgi:hypothetical protein